MRIRTVQLAILFVLVALLWSCGAVTDEPTLRNEPNPAASTSNVSTENRAVHHFVKQARKQFKNSRLNAAEETINRGLNIDSENPVLWHILAKIRFLQEKYPESETFASRSIDYSDDNRQLNNENWRLIAYARKRLGNEDGARVALNNIVVEEEKAWWVFW